MTMDIGPGRSSSQVYLQQNKKKARAPEKLL
jgi:hypothetical protein